MDVLDRFYPERRIAGFTRDDHRIVFYNQVNAILRPDMKVLDFGAGRGKWAERETGYQLALTTLKGKCSEVIGCDIDEAVLSNPLVDRAVVVKEHLPFPDGYFDLIVSWAVFEHISTPSSVASELSRVLKPGGWICAWTPCKWSYFSIAARIIPKRFHSRLAAITTGRLEKDIFPTVYKLNTIRDISKHFRGYQNFSYYYSGPPSYHANSVLLAWLWKAWTKFLPPQFAQQIHVFLRKPNHSES